jgi:glutathione S-transferase
MLTLHQMQMSGNCYKVRLVAHQLGIPLKLIDYPVVGTATRTLEFLNLNPNGRTPVLEFEDGRVLPESGAILFYLSDGTRLQPDSKWDRACMLQWMFFEQYSHEPYVAVSRYWHKFAPLQEFEKKRHLSRPGMARERKCRIGCDGSPSQVARLVRRERLFHRRHRAVRIYPLRGGWRFRS